MRRRWVLLLVLLPALLAPSAAQALPGTWERGLNMTAYWWQDLSGTSFKTWLTRARTDERATWVTFVVPWYQDTLSSTALRTSPGSPKDCGKGRYDGKSTLHCKTPSLAAIRSAVIRAHKLGLHVVLRPQVEVGQTSDQAQPRDQIDTGDAGDPAWFASYRALLGPYLAMAKQTHAEEFIVGTGLSKMTDTDVDRGYWRTLITDIRSGALGGGYKGKLTYAAQWDSVIGDALDPNTHPFFWDLLDEVGVDAYFPLVAPGAPAVPSLATLRAGWTTDPTHLGASPVRIIGDLHAEYGKPVRFTALGYLSRGGTAAFPENSDQQQAAAGGKQSLTVQARAIRAAFDVWSPISEQGWFRGISWWEWPAAGRGGGADGSFSLEGKPGATEVCRGHAASRTAKCPFHQP